MANATLRGNKDKVCVHVEITQHGTCKFAAGLLPCNHQADDHQDVFFITCCGLLISSLLQEDKLKSLSTRLMQVDCQNILSTSLMNVVFVIMIKYYSGFSKVFIKLFIFATFRTVLPSVFKLFTYLSLQKSRLQLRKCHQPSHAHAFQNYLYARAHASVFRFTI